MAVLKRRSEASLLLPVSRYLRRRGFRRQTQELRFYEYRIDLCATRRSGETTVAVELKVEDWRRAFQQALIYQLCCDWSWIAMPAENTGRVDATLLSAHGIGLISVGGNGRCRELLPPKLSEATSPSYRASYAKLIEGRAGDRR